MQSTVRKIFHVQAVTAFAVTEGAAALILKPWN